MRILVLSDSHSAMRFMRDCMQKIKPDAVVHLGDHYDDAEALHEEFPGCDFHIVPGNCDAFRCRPGIAETLCYTVGGVRLLMTHGHRYCVKIGTGALIADARAMHAQAALYGHTHQAQCVQLDDGIWVLNPGSCGYGAGTAGLIETCDNRISDCRILTQSELEEWQ